MEIILFVWCAFFVIAAIPGGAVGYLIARLPVGLGWLTFLSAYVAALAGYVISSIVVPTDVITTTIHAHNIALFSPPIFAAIFMGALAKRYPRPTKRAR
ncbi:hypothetical protein [Tardiphaga sp. 768_D3_N2_1]|uniref:hypothetical protein n=1 Tax=Tardiphaga sp. 768_D3_N2_1 TaxID=3240783 RepID=UPI003F8BC75F